MDDKLYDELFEHSLHIGEYDGAMFIIFDSWSEVEYIEQWLADNRPDMDINDLDWGFCDEYDICSDCFNIIRTSPDSYSWQPEYDIDEYGIFCSDCIQNSPEYYLDNRINQNKLVNEYMVDPSEHGWTMVDIEYANGYHYGQNDNPNAIIESLNEHNIDCLFTGNVGQFDVHFNVWVKSEVAHFAKYILSNSNVELPYDQATELAKALKGEHSDYITVKEYTLSQEDFIAGNLPE
jgi:hypothetical protein